MEVKSSCELRGKNRCGGWKLGMTIWMVAKHSCLMFLYLVIVIMPVILPINLL